MTRMALVASHHVLVPTRADYLSTQGSDNYARHLHDVVSHHNAVVASTSGEPPIDTGVIGVLFTVVTTQERPAHQGDADLHEPVCELGHGTFDRWVHARNSHSADAAETGVPIVLSLYAQHRGTVENLREVARDFAARLATAPSISSRWRQGVA